MFTLAFSQDLRERQAQDGSDVTVSGPFLLIRRRAYDVVGGHAAVGSAIAEDVALARILKRHGFKVVLRSGDRLLSARMYTGWRTVWPGLAKNLVDTLGGRHSLCCLSRQRPWRSPRSRRWCGKRRAPSPISARQ